MKNIIKPNPVILKWAREQAGYTLKDVTDKLKKKSKKISHQDLIDFEKGTAFPTYSQMEFLAYQLYKRPLAIFFFPKPPDESDIKKSFRTLLEPINKLSPAMRWTLRKARVRQLNLKELHEKIKQDKKIFQDINFTSQSSIKNLAQKARDYLKIDLSEQKKWKSASKAFTKWREALESSGIFVFKDSFKEPDFSGFCLYDSDFPVIYINSKQTDSRQVFTLFHELAHILFRTSGFDHLDKNYFRGQLKEKNKKIETMCNQFAGAFLVPDEILSPTIYSKSVVTMNSIDKWAKEYSVSPEVFLRRIRDHKIISQIIYKNLVQEFQSRYQKLSKEKSKDIVPFYTVQESRLGKKYISLVYSKYYKNQISVEQLADFLDVKPAVALNLEPHGRIKTKNRKELAI